jgi:ABC-2 type transport system ATP-binding protein
MPMPAARSSALSIVGAIVEEPRFHSHLTGRENLVVAAAVRGSEAPRRVGAMLERVGLADRAGDRVGGYSLGTLQRLGIARCLLSNPRLLILDEPMNGLDPAGILEMRHMIRSLVDEGRTVMVSSHLLDEVEKTCDAVAIIDRGKLIAVGPIWEIAHGGRQILVGCDDTSRAAAVLEGRHAGGGLSIDSPGVLRVTLGQGVTVWTCPTTVGSHCTHRRGGRAHGAVHRDVDRRRGVPRRAAIADQGPQLPAHAGCGNG